VSKPRPQHAHGVIAASAAGVGVGVGAASVAHTIGGKTTSDVAAELGITQQRASQLEIRALSKLARGCRLEKFVFPLPELRGARAARVFAAALTHALAEKRLAEHFGITVTELQTWLEHHNIRSSDLTSWKLP